MIKSSEDLYLYNDQMKEVYKTLPKAILAGLGGGLTLRAIQAFLRKEQLLHRGAEKHYGKILKDNPALLANRERKLRIPALQPEEPMERTELPIDIALKANVIDPEDVNTTQVPKPEEVDAVQTLQKESEYVPLAKLAAGSNPNKTYATDTATALVSGRSQGRGILGSLTDALVPTELKPRLQREWIDATNPMGTFFRGTREYSLDNSGNPEPGDYIKDQKAWQIPAAYPLWALSAGTSGLAAYYALHKFLKDKKKQRLDEELNDARAQFEAALTYEAAEAKKRKFKRAGYSDLLDACAEFHEELDKCEQLYEKFANDQVVQKQASLTKAYLGGISTLSALMGLMAAHRSYKHSKRRAEQAATNRLLEGRDKPSDILSGFGERLLDRRFRSGYGFELSDTDPVSFDDSNIKPYVPVKDVVKSKK
jgi:hypothetical protein